MEAAAATSARTAAKTMPAQTTSWRHKTLKSLMERRMAGISVIYRGEKRKKETDQEEEQEERERLKR